MKEFLLFLVSLFSLSLNAQTWTAPERPLKAKVEGIESLEPVSSLSDSYAGETYQVMNVESQQFLAGAKTWYSWATSAGLVNAASALQFKMTEEVEAIDDIAAQWTFARTSDNKYVFMSSNGSYFNRPGWGEMHVDMGPQGHNYFELLKQNNGYYHIRIAQEDVTYGEDAVEDWADRCWGWEGLDSEYPTAVYGSVKPSDGFYCDWAFVQLTDQNKIDLANAEAEYQAKLPLYQAKLALYEQAKLIVEEGLMNYDENLNYQNYTEVYNGEDVDVINAATTELAAQVVEARKLKAWATGTEDNPSDITFLLVNPSMNEGNPTHLTIPNGWTVEVPGAQNKGYQSVTYTNNIGTEETNTNFGVSISGYLDVWVPGKGLGTGKIFQSVELPMGKYVLSVDVIATKQYGEPANYYNLDGVTNGYTNSKDEATGFQLYALGGDIDNGIEVCSLYQNPEHYDFEFITAGGTTELGLRMIDATGNWLGADNFTLTYKGYRRLTLNVDSISLSKNSSIGLQVTPNHVVDSLTYIWLSTDTSVATVENGLVRGVGAGVTNIIVSAEGFEPDTCMVTVTTSPVSGIQLSESAVTIHKGLTHQLTATVLPSDASNTNVIWSSTDEAVATVDQNGLVTAVGKGTAMIIALTEEGYKSAMCTVTVDNVVTAISLNNETLTIAKGGTAQLTATCTPADADDLSLTWASSDETVATVDATGLVTAIGKGTATITVTAATGVSAQCVVTVTNPMTSFRFANATLTLQKGSSQALTLVPTPADADPVTLVWSSTDETVATVDENGVLTAIDLGTTVIVAYSPDINKSATCVVTVTKKNITLADGTPYVNDTEEECGTITYTRTFNNTNFQALYVPFEMTYADWQADFEVYYIDNIRQHDDNGDGVIDRTMMDIFLLKEGSSLYANMPYVIRAKTTGEKTITLTDATLYPAEENSLECSSTSMRYTITGTYEGVSSSMMDSNSWYALGGGSLIQTDGSNDLGAFRWYLSAESKGGVFKNSLPNEIKLQVIGDETGVESIDNEQWKMDNNAVYDLSGRHIVNYKSSNRQIPSGIYIRNGRKVVIK